MAGPLAFFADMNLPQDLSADLRSFNPWWEGDAMPLLPSVRRHLVPQIRRSLDLGLAPAVVVRGPRQIGKTTAQLQLIQDLLDEEVDPRRILRIQFDELDSLKKLREPILRVADWFERHVAPKRFNALARDGEPAYLFFDEIQNLRGWDAQLKSLVDRASVKAVVTGSSALRIEAGRDSLAGRITTIEAGVLSLTEIGALRGFSSSAPFLEENGISNLRDKEYWAALRDHGAAQQEFRDEAFRFFSERGGYPIAHKEKDVPMADLTGHLNETVIQRVIQHDLQASGRGMQRDPELLEEVLRLACRYAGQAPNASTLTEEAHLKLGSSINYQRVVSYLKLLGDTLLLRLVPPLELRLKKNRGGPKICLADHSLRACWLQEQIPLAPDILAEKPEMSHMAGRIAESVFGAAASTIHGLDIAHFPQRGMDQEVDFVLTVGNYRIPVEVKYRRRIDSHRDTLGLRSFLEKSANNAPFGILITQVDAETVDDPRIVSLPLSTFLMLR